MAYFINDVGLFVSLGASSSSFFARHFLPVSLCVDLQGRATSLTRFFLRFQVLSFLNSPVKK